MVGGPKNVPNAKNSHRQSILPGEKDQKHENRSFYMISRIPHLFILFAPENRFFVEVRISTKKNLKAEMPNFPTKMSEKNFQPDHKNKDLGPLTASVIQTACLHPLSPPCQTDTPCGPRLSNHQRSNKRVTYTTVSQDQIRSEV